MWPPYPYQAQNSIIRDVFTADPAPLVYRDTLFLYTGHDTASVSDTNYKMPDWRIYSTTDMVHCQDYGTRLSPKNVLCLSCGLNIGRS